MTGEASNYDEILVEPAVLSFEDPAVYGSFKTSGTGCLCHTMLCEYCVGAELPRIYPIKGEERRGSEATTQYEQSMPSRTLPLCWYSFLPAAYPFTFVERNTVADVSSNSSTDSEMIRMEVKEWLSFRNESL